MQSIVLVKGREVFKKIGIDGAIAYTVLARVFQAGGGLISIMLISLFLSKEEQGYYYTFGSILAIQVFFELGLGFVITQFVAHESVHLKFDDTSGVSGDAKHLSRLSSLLRFCLIVFAILAVILFIVLSIAGSMFFTKFHATDVDWKLPWITLVLPTSLMLFVNPVLSFLEGLGKVKDVAKIRLTQQILNTVTVALVFISKGALFAPGIAASVSLLVIVGSIVFTGYRHLLVSILRQKGEFKVNYWKEIFPFQYKIAISWISGYFIFQLFNPVLFATEGAVVAGQMGMTLVALNGISSLSMSWMSTKVPMFCSLVANKAYDKLDEVFNRSLVQLASVNIMLLIAFLAFVAILSFLNIPLAHRFLSTVPLTMMCLVTFINQLIFSWATYLRSHNKEPFLINSIVGAILCALSTVLLGRHFGLMGIVGGYTLITVLMGLPWAYLLFINKKKQWHLS